MNLKKLYNIMMIFILLNVIKLSSIERIETNQNISNDRDYSLSYYENETAISHWYGSETWAVKFVANDFMINANSITITQVNIYFPTIPQSPVNIRGLSYNENSQYDPLFGDNVSELNILNQSITETGWHQFPLTSAYTGEGLWVTVDNVTNFSNNFMASASGSGENSYYKVNNGGDVYFTSLYDLNISQELLFSLDGHLNIENDTDKVVIEEINIEYSHEDLWTYDCTIRNFSSEFISSADLEIAIQHPNPEVYPGNSIHLTLDLTAQSDIATNGGEPLMIQLPIADSQYKIVSSLRRDTSSVVLSSKTNRVCNFHEESDIALVMNFVSGNHQITENLLGTQRLLAQNNWLIFNYGIDGSDQLFYSNYAYDYYQDFGVNLLPLTVINGTKYFNSFNIEAMEENLENNIYYIPKVFDTINEGLEENGSLITYYKEFNYGDRFVFDTFTDNLAIDVFITQKTKHYSVEGDEFIVAEISDVLYDFDRLSEDGNATFEFTYDVDNVDSLFTTTNGDKFANAIIYREDTNEIVSFNRYPLENNILVSNQDNEDVISIPTLSVYPNPVQAGAVLNITSSNKSDIEYYTLYNLRGQKVDKFINKNETIKLRKNISSGIYFLRASSSSNKRGPLVKFMIIKE